MSGKIYVLQENGSLRTLEERAYVSEARLQELLAAHHGLLAGDQIDEENPRRWLLISREIGVPTEEDGGEWMSLDHLFLDQDAVPTLVEVKRSSDVRVRREVVGQMLDYAANAVSYWSIERLRARFESQCEDPEAVLTTFLEMGQVDKDAIESFWEQVDVNLRAGKIRLLFVADHIPPELRRIVEFLNTYMDPVEVLAVEVQQYVGKELKTLVPRVIGQTARSNRKSGTRPQKQWDEQTFFKELTKRQSEAESQVARAILDWARNQGLEIWWGKGVRNGSFVPSLYHKDVQHQLFAVWTGGTLEVYFYWYQYKAPFDSESKRLALLERLNTLPRITLPQNTIGKRPNLPLSLFTESQVLEQFLDIFDWVVAEIKAT